MQNLQWYPGHMAKTRRLIEANLKLIDVVVEILDARIPFSGRNPHFDDIIKNKPRLLVLNKADLADKNRTKLWIDWYAEQGLKVIPISCTTGMGINTVLAEARALIQDKIDRERERGRNRTLKIMMVGIPNVGKSVRQAQKQVTNRVLHAVSSGLELKVMRNFLILPVFFRRNSRTKQLP